jgi:hypothetical protein
MGVCISAPRLDRRLLERVVRLDDTETLIRLALYLDRPEALGRLDLAPRLRM